MDNPSLSELQQLLTSNTEEASSIKADLDKARELLVVCDLRLRKLLGGPLPKDQPQKSLKIFIKNVLNTSNEPLTVKEVAELVLEAGYKTNSGKNFRNIVQQALKNDAEIRRKTKPKTRPSRYTIEE